MKKISINTKLLLALIASSMILAFSSSKIYADEYENKNHLESIVHDFVIQHVESKVDERVNVQIHSLDANTQLSRCTSTIDASFAKGNSPGQSNAVVLQCHSEGGWSVYVPVSIQVLSKVVAANRLISPGEIITEHDLSYEEYDKNKLYDGFFKEMSDVVGLSVVRSVSTGTALTKRMVRQVAIIKRNQAVTLVLKTGAVEVDMIGIAKSDGYLNEVVKVMNPSSKKVIDAIVIGSDRAQIIV